MTTIYLVRHGRTALNPEGRFRGRHDVPLDDVGLKEAAVAADALSAVKLAAAYSSPLARAHDTADVIAQRCGIEVIVMPALTDLDYGAWQGLTQAEARSRDPREYETFKSDPLRAGPPGGESIAALKTRVLRCLEQIATQSAAAPVAAVTHEVPMRAVLAETSDGGDRFWDHDVATGAMFALAIRRDDGWSIRPWPPL
ncbi:MAG: histidine phosphatase family protein [Actinomycetota bacterium]